MNKTNQVSQWNPPENSNEFLEWLKEYHPKWVKDLDINTLRNILTTSDGLGTKVKTKALDALMEMK